MKEELLTNKLTIVQLTQVAGSWFLVAYGNSNKVIKRLVRFKS
jgi:hypothetical protein